MATWPNCTGRVPLSLFADTFRALKLGNMLELLGRGPLQMMQTLCHPTDHTPL